MGTEFATRRARLGAALAATRGLWSPPPWRDLRPAWTQERPQLHAALLALDDGDVDRLADDADELTDFLRDHVPGLDTIAELSTVEPAPTVPLADPGPHFDWAIPGRKREQIEAFAAAVGRPQAAVVDWCGGKGHLGRFLAAQWRCPVDSLDHDPALVAAAAGLAARARQPGQGAEQVDVLADDPDLAGRLRGRHVVALHACGDLHRRLVTLAAEAGVAALDLAPCCHDRGAAEVLAPATADGLRLDRAERRLAVTGSVTAAPREDRRRERENAWKLGFFALLSAPEAIVVRPLRPLAADLLRGDFPDFCRRLAAREGVELPPQPDFAAAAAAGEARWRRVRRLDLLRFAFRRPLEVWLALDLAAALEARGYGVGITRFCAAALSPRNLLLSARPN